MSQTHCNLIYHLVFSTKERRPYLTQDCGPAIHRYLAGAVQGIDGIPLIVNGTEDHVHLLVKLHQKHALSDVLREIKANSSNWIHRTYSGLSDFASQTGYGAFTVSASQKNRIWKYVEDQETHHRKFNFKREYIGLLKKNEIEYDEQYVWD